MYRNIGDAMPVPDIAGFEVPNWRDLPWSADFS